MPTDVVYDRLGVDPGRKQRIVFGAIAVLLLGFFLVDASIIRASTYMLLVIGALIGKALA